MRKFPLPMIISILILLMVPVMGRADDSVIFKKGYNALLHGDHKRALYYFRILEDKKVTSPQLFYDMGILYFEKGDYGRARLYFERARFLDPGFADNNFNLRALSDYLEKNYPVELKVDTGVSGWHDWLGSFRISTLMYILTGVFLLLLIAGFFAFLTGNWKWIVAAVSLFVVWFGLVVVGWSKIEYDTTQMGVTLAGTEMHMAPDSGSKVMLKLPIGVKFQVVRRSVDWILIKLANGLTGWIVEKNIGLINPPYFYHVPSAVRRILSIPAG